MVFWSKIKNNKRLAVLSVAVFAVLIGSIAYLVLSGKISADTATHYSPPMTPSTCVAGENYRITSNGSGPDTSISITGNYTTLGSLPSNVLSKIQGMPVEYNLGKDAFHATATYVSFFGNGLYNNADLPEDIIINLYNVDGNGSTREINLGKLNYNADTASATAVNLARVNRYYRIDFTRRVGTSSELMVSCSASGTARAQVGVSRYQAPAISVSQYNQAYRLGTCTTAPGWTANTPTRGRYQKTYSTLDPSQASSVQQIIGKTFSVGAGVMSGAQINHPPFKTILTVYYDVYQCPLANGAKLKIPDKIMGDFLLRDGSRKSGTSEQIELQGMAGGLCQYWYKAGQRQGINRDYSDIVSVDWYRVSSTNSNLKEPIKSCTRSLTAATASPTPTSNTTSTTTATPTATATISITTTPTRTASAVTTVSALVSTTPTRTATRTATVTPTRTATPRPTATAGTCSLFGRLTGTCNTKTNSNTTTATTDCSWFTRLIGKCR